MHEMALNNCSLKGSRHETAQPRIPDQLRAVLPLPLAECQASIAPADALASIPDVPGAALSILPRRKALAAAFFSVYPILGRGIGSRKVPRGPGDVGKASACSLQQPRGCRVCRLVSSPVGGFIQASAAGTGCKPLRREDGATGKPSALLQDPPRSPSWRRRRGESVCPLPGMKGSSPGR